jgi:hypothetical protein
MLSKGGIHSHLHQHGCRAYFNPILNITIMQTIQAIKEKPALK